MNPHPETQTLYAYPFSVWQVTGTLMLSTFPIFIGAVVASKRILLLRLGFCYLVVGLIFFALVSPDVGTTKRRLVETPTGFDKIYVLRPLVARKKCEVQRGVTGGNPYRSESILGLWPMKVRHEPAHWIVNW